MKYVLKDLAPRPEKDLFITQYWSDKQSDPPLHFHEDYMLSLTLNVRGTRITGRTADDFTEKDLIIIFPGVPHCYTRDEAYADIDCEAVAVQFSRDMPNWQLFETEYLQPIQKMLSLPVAGLHFSEMVVDRVRERLLQLPGLRGFESVVLFLDILNDLATAGPDEIHVSERRITRRRPTATNASRKSCSSWKTTTTTKSRSKTSAPKWACPPRRYAAISRRTPARISGPISTGSASCAPRR